MKGTSRWLAAGMCACLVAALQWGGAPETMTGPAAAPSSRATPASRAPVARIGGDVSVVGEQHPIVLDAAMARRAMRDGVLRVALPDGTSYPVRMERQETDRFGQWTIVGRVRTAVGAQAAVLTFGGNAVFGTLPMPDGHALQIVTNHDQVLASRAGGLAPGGLVAMADTPAMSPRSAINARLRASMHLSPAAAPAVAPVAKAVANAAPKSASAAPRIAVADAPVEPVTITVLALYADDLVALRGSVAAVQTELSNQIAAANQVHIDSNTIARLVLVGIEHIDMPSTTTNDDALYAMTSAPVGTVDTELLRDQYAADLATLVRPYADYANCGIAWAEGSGGNGMSGADNLLGYSVVNAEPCGPHVMAHELGHNLGSSHDRLTEANNDGTITTMPAYNFGFGYRNTRNAPGYSTVMAYAEDEPWIGRYSSPLANDCGGPCGAANADDVRSIALMAGTVSLFRTAPGTVSIADGAAFEHDAGGLALLRFKVRLSEPAPAGGLNVYGDVIFGGTADAQDFDTVSGSAWIPQGTREGTLPISIRHDTQIEPDDTFYVRLRDGAGHPVERDTALGTILNDDPRVHLRAQLVLPKWSYIEGETAVSHVGADGGDWSGALQTPANNPEHVHDIAVVPGASVAVRYAMTGTANFIGRAELANDVWHDRLIQLPLAQYLNVDGYLGIDGDHLRPPPVEDDVTVRVTFGNGQPDSLRYFEFAGSAYFNAWVYPGSTIELYAPIYRTWGNHLYYRYENVQQGQRLELRPDPRPTVVITGGRVVQEGQPGKVRHVPLEIRKLPGPAATTTVTWRTVNGTAKAGEDYVAASGTVTLTPEAPAQVVFVDLIGDDRHERPESFDVVLDDAPAYNITVPKTHVTLADDDHRTGSTSPKLPVP